MKLIKATLIGGAIFLVPLMILLMVLGKAFQIMLRIALPISEAIGMESIGGIALVNLLAVVLMVASCLLAGMAARSPWGRYCFRALDSKLILFVPGYLFLKGMVSGFSDESGGPPLKPVLVKLDDSTQIGLEVERNENGIVTVYLPGAPNPWSGTIVLMIAERIEPLDMTLSEVSKHIRRLGRDLKLPYDLKIT